MYSLLEKFDSNFRPPAIRKIELCATFESTEKLLFVTVVVVVVIAVMYLHYNGMTNTSDETWEWITQAKWRRGWKKAKIIKKR